jgi:hypothetical protein
MGFRDAATTALSDLVKHSLEEGAIRFPRSMISYLPVFIGVCII